MRPAPPLEAEVPSWVMWLLAAAAQSITVAFIVAIGSVDIGGAPLAAYLFALAFGAVLLVARWVPVTVLIASLLGVFGYYALDLPPIGMAVPLVGAFFAVAERGRLLTAVITGGVLLTISVYFRAGDGENYQVLSYELVTNLALIAAAIALAWVVRSRRRLGEQQRQLVALERRQERQQMAQRAEAERVRVARDVHDSIGHALSLVSVQAKVGQQSVGVDDRAALAALASIDNTSAIALADLRHTLTMLRSDRESADVAQLSPASLSDLAHALDDAGLDVTLDITEVELPAPISSAIHRIIQEATTNALRHSRAHSITISLRRSGDGVQLQVADDGVGAAGADGSSGSSGSGRGLDGMRARAESLGGTFSAESTPSGFVVTALLPVTAMPSESAASPRS